MGYRWAMLFQSTSSSRKPWPGSNKHVALPSCRAAELFVHVGGLAYLPSSGALIVLRDITGVHQGFCGHYLQKESRGSRQGLWGRALLPFDLTST